METNTFDHGHRADKPSPTWTFSKHLLEAADIKLNGDRPWDIQVHRERALERALAYGNLGFGEAYMDGDWDAEALDQLFARLLRAGIADRINPIRLGWHVLRARWLNLQNQRRAWEVGERHYDIGNDFYASMLDERMTYTCGYWRQATTLDAAQTAKLDLICRKLDLQPGMRVLDIGCGWGSFIQYAAEHYGVHCVGITVSNEQANLARQRCQALPVEIRVQDYRDLNEHFDHIVSIGMFEHVGRKNHRTYLDIASRCLRSEGFFLLHTIGKNLTRSAPDPWLDRHIFPNGDLPSLAQITQAAEGRFVIEDVHNFGSDYDKTLMAWHANFETAWPRFQHRYGERFRRMWRYYLLCCAGAFRARRVQLWQIVLSKQGKLGGYRRVS
ncbi:cyclopropane-fatty-acyl-phospholipid synthase [Alkalilimnicola ehrlichii]|uniref:Cyclopropane-fatty-acyl-phospholipid synthase n=1 Tax=Alkalilimnicola ehrlichii TaxID=351052 RepID=A0A3E0WSX1_9GAMM|nr:cyclopropane fatty acyl phospholipid synthase [Alkalilimnicola ehrlichii]RFA29157.1 cyclopropane-fatty-acyl-phospholipid synthase [Alkalilimnicola ehrlichii]RFA36070.1 cyclopropane-fatty-acyl-phospholipid synthase [Alkalilimnicola ehrlichii]